MQQLTQSDTFHAKDRQPPLQKDIIPEQLLSFIKLLLSIMYQYTNLPPWKDIPSTEELSSEKQLTIIKKKLDITLSILYKHAVREEHKDIQHVLLFTINLFKADPNILSKVTKLNLLINSGICLLKLTSKDITPEMIDKTKIDYLQGIIKNFYLAYGQTNTRRLEHIGNQLAFFVHNEAFFDYEYFFLYEDEYLVKEYIPQLKLQTRKLVISFNEDLISEFELSSIDYLSAESTIYYEKFLEELQHFKEFKSTHSKEEYAEYKKQVKTKIGSPIKSIDI